MASIWWILMNISFSWKYQSGSPEHATAKTILLNGCKVLVLILFVSFRFPKDKASLPDLSSKEPDYSLASISVYIKMSTSSSFPRNALQLSTVLYVIRTKTMKGRYYHLYPKGKATGVKQPVTRKWQGSNEKVCLPGTKSIIFMVLLTSLPPSYNIFLTLL